MLQTDIFLNATQSLEQINAWQIEQETKEEKQKFLIQEKKRNEQKTTELTSQQQKDKDFYFL